MMTMLDHHRLVGVAVPPAVVPTMVAMLAEFGTRAIALVMAALDYDGLGAGNRRSRDGDSAKRCENISKLLHVSSFLN